MKNVLLKLKAKGLKNTEFYIKACLSPDYEHAICASEDGGVYLWSKIESTVVECSKKGLLSKVFNKTKINEGESFFPNSNPTDLISLQNTTEKLTPRNESKVGNLLT